MIQESGLHWNSNATGSLTSQTAHDIHLAKIKEEFADSFPKFTETLNSPSSIEDSHLTTTSYSKNEQKDLNDLSEKLLLKTISSGFPINGHQFSAGDFYSNTHNNISSFGSAMPSRGNFSQIYPSINISNLNQSSSATSSSFDMNLQALDLLTSARFNGNFSHSSHDNLGMYKESLPFGFEIQQSSRRPSCSPSNKISSSSPFNNSETTAEAKRPSGNLMEPKATQSQSGAKKSRLESRASCPPFKVRKEKLGDRIAALQQLVAPFGKTDTASVLMEAIGYIKFLQNQVETLSVPYMKSARDKSSRTMQGGSMEETDEEPKRDLRSRGLCLVPLSCMSYVTNDAGAGGIWPPPTFGGGT
ncbi:putative Transcription factor [Melia azedarach]|nr:putative Transcription factor [Melia azedarach]